MEEKNVLFKKQTTHYTTNIYKPFCSIIVEKPKEIIDDLTEDVEIDTQALIERNKYYADEDLDDQFYNSETDENQLLALIHCNKKFIKMLLDLRLDCIKLELELENSNKKNLILTNYLGEKRKIMKEVK
jgi:hypothetical protein